MEIFLLGFFFAFLPPILHRNKQWKIKEKIYTRIMHSDNALGVQIAHSRNDWDGL